MSFYVGGAAGMRNRGTYAAGTQYFVNDLVQYNGSSYIATATTLGNLPTNTSYWSVLASGVTGGGVPAGGTAGQVLTKNPGTTDYDTSWASPSSGGSAAFLPWTSGRTFTQPGYFNGGLVSIASNTLYFYPMRVPNACTVGAVSLQPSASVNTSLYIALYSDAGNAVTSGGPGTRLAANSSSVSGAQQIMVYPSCTFAAPTSIWVAVAVSSTVQVLAFTNVVSNFLIGGTGSFYNYGTATCRAAPYGYSNPPPADMTTVSTTIPANTVTPVIGLSVS